MNSSEGYQEHFKSRGIHKTDKCAKCILLPFHSLISMVVLAFLVKKITLLSWIANYPNIFNIVIKLANYHN